MRNKKEKKYNKFFSYKNEDRTKRNFKYKDFGYSNSYNTNFAESIFFGNNFYRACMKYCSFARCKFEFIEFDSANFRGSRFKGAEFKNVLFCNCTFDKTNFAGAHFENVYCINSNIKCEGIQPIKDRNVEISFGSELNRAIDECRSNKYIVESDTLFYRPKNRFSKKMKQVMKQMSKAEQKEYQRQMQKISAKEKKVELNRLNLMRLLNVYSEIEVAAGLKLASKKIEKSFCSMSYYLPYIQKAKKYIEILD